MPLYKSCGWLLLVILFSGCATPLKRLSREVSTSQLIAHLCERAQQVRQVEGRAALKIHTQKESGRLNAWIQAQRTPAHFVLEATDLLGRQVVFLQLSGGKILIRDAKGETRTKAGSGRWMGVPLSRATPLLLGAPDCPSTLGVDTQWTRLEPDTLRVQNGRLRDEYVFEVWQGKPWIRQWNIFGAQDSKEPIVKVEYFSPDLEGISTHWVADTSEGKISFWWRSRRNAEK